LNLSNEHITVAKTLSRIASVHSFLYDDSNATIFFTKALKTYRKCLVLDDSVISNEIESNSGLKDAYLDYAESAYSLGITCEAMETYNDANDCFIESLRIFKCALGKENVNVAKTLNSIGHLQAKNKKFDKAEALLKEASRLCRLKSDDELLATTLFGLGIVMEKTQRYANALQCFEQALEIRTRKFGRISIEVAQALNNIAIVLGNMSKFDDAITKWKEALTICNELDVPYYDDMVLAINNYIELAHSHIK